VRVPPRGRQRRSDGPADAGELSRVSAGAAASAPTIAPPPGPPLRGGAVLSRGDRPDWPGLPRSAPVGPAKPDIFPNRLTFACRVVSFPASAVPVAVAPHRRALSVTSTSSPHG